MSNHLIESALQVSGVSVFYIFDQSEEVLPKEGLHNVVAPGHGEGPTLFRRKPI